MSELVLKTCIKVNRTIWNQWRQASRFVVTALPHTVGLLSLTGDVRAFPQGQLLPDVLDSISKERKNTCFPLASQTRGKSSLHKSTSISPLYLFLLFIVTHQISFFLVADKKKPRHFACAVSYQHNRTSFFFAWFMANVVLIHTEEHLT